MSRRGKDAGRKVNRGPVQGWTEVENVPYEGESPGVGRVPAATRRWWQWISTMPHCALWGPSDWSFAVDTAKLHAALSRGELRWASEIRAREKQMGTTIKARELLKIRYVEVEDEESTAAPVMTGAEEERWRRLIDEDEPSDA